jgi:hypothetical protein
MIYAPMEGIVMRRFTILAIALLAIGCSSHSSMPSSRMPNTVAPQVYQGYGGGQTWTTIKIVPAHSQGINVTSYQPGPLFVRAKS